MKRYGIANTDAGDAYCFIGMELQDPPRLAPGPARPVRTRNFLKLNRSIHMTPAMAAGLTRRPWSIGDLLR